MEEPFHLLRYTFPHLMGALPQLKSFNGVGNTVYAIVVLPTGDVTLSGPALEVDGTKAWPKAANIAAKDFFQKRTWSGRQSEIHKCSVTALLVVSIAGVWHCAAINIPIVEKLRCDESTPLLCANSVLDDLPGSG